MIQAKDRGQLIVLSGPSGTGKSTVIGQLLRDRSDIHFSVSYTTRAPREGEVNGVNYNFVDRQEFERMIADHELLEHAEYVNNYYGTSLKVIEDNLTAGTDVLLDIEVLGAAKVRERCPDALFIFLAPPSIQVLEQRLRGRGTDSEEVISGRLEKAKVELKEIPKYDYLIINEQVSNAVNEIKSILTAAACRVENRTNIIKGVFAL